MKNTLLLSALFLTACSAWQAAPEKTYDFAAVDTLLSEAIKTGRHVGTSALVFDEGKVVYRAAYGKADRRTICS